MDHSWSSRNHEGARDGTQVSCVQGRCHPHCAVTLASEANCSKTSRLCLSSWLGVSTVWSLSLAQLPILKWTVPRVCPVVSDQAPQELSKNNCMQVSARSVWVPSPWPLAGRSASPAWSLPCCLCRGPIGLCKCPLPSSPHGVGVSLAALGAQLPPGPLPYAHSGQPRDT